MLAAVELYKHDIHATGVTTAHNLPLSAVQFVQAVLGMAPNDKTVIALCGIGKLFVGELVEMGKWSDGQLYLATSAACHSHSHRPHGMRVPPTLMLFLSVVCTERMLLACSWA